MKNMKFVFLKSIVLGILSGLFVFMITYCMLEINNSDVGIVDYVSIGIFAGIPICAYVNFEELRKKAEQKSSVEKEKLISQISLVLRIPTMLLIVIVALAIMLKLTVFAYFGIALILAIEIWQLGNKVAMKELKKDIEQINEKLKNKK